MPRGLDLPWFKSGPTVNLPCTGFGSDAAAAGMKRALAAGARRPLLVAQGSLPAGNRAEVS